MPPAAAGVAGNGWHDESPRKRALAFWVPRPERRLAVRLGGMLGTVTTRTISTSEGEGIDPDAAAFEEFNELYESSVPVSDTSYSDYSAAPAAAGYGN